MNTPAPERTNKRDSALGLICQNVKISKSVEGGQIKNGSEGCQGRGGVQKR